jgi:Taurine catabolism dioxygenase TauD, TfdA family
MVTICDHPIDDATAWTSRSLNEDTSWQVILDDTDLGEIRAALKAVDQAGFMGCDFGWGDFPLDRLKTKLDRVRELIKSGPGLALIRGLNVDRYDEQQLAKIYWGVGVHLGIPVGQNRKGDRIGRVEAVLKAGQPVGDRGYNRPGSLPFHADFSDTVGLLCIRKAQSGGTSLIVSSTTLHNQVLRDRPDLLLVLYEGMYTNLRNEGPRRLPNERSLDPVKAFEFFDGKVSCFFSIDRYKGGQEAVGGKPLSALQIEALEYMNRLAQNPDYHHQMDFEPGDIQFLNNHTVLHARTNYVDFPEPERRRLLLRIWIRFEEENYRVSPARSRVFRWGMDQVLPAMA